MTVLYVILALFVFGLLVMIHELGHFLAARAFGVGIKEFSIGMGPKIFSKKGKGEWEAGEAPPAIHLDASGELTAPPQDRHTAYSLRALPIGGYVSMVGEDEESDSPAAFGSKPVWQRILIVIAGPLMNIVLGFLLMLVLVLSTRDAAGEIALASNRVGAFSEGAISQTFGLEVGDEITHVNGTRVHTGNEVMYEIMNQGYEPLELTVRRGEQELLLEGVMFPGMEEQGIAFGNPDFKVYREKTSFGTVLKHTFFRSVSTVKMILDQLGDLLTGRFGLNAVSGPVGVTEVMTDAAKTGFDSFLYLVIVITVNLGVFNLLPIPALDGGRLLFLLIELVTRRPVNKNVEGYIHFVGMMLLLLLMVVIACKDIAGLFVR